ncbi:hypothetical protein CRG98_040140 [Punica granatum]|uniref:Uncharacterized protein n=1 Tax=Punica granatum TaxID=22663 RepID=A0A2I0I630_PUNGR|nr:hypothetical protein CRG98_040140 [Punica granatum]
MDRSKHVEVKLPEDSRDEGPTTPKFEDERWKKGTWDLNMFVENGRVDWDGIIVAAKRLWEAVCFSLNKFQFLPACDSPLLDGAATAHSFSLIISLLYHLVMSCRRSKEEKVSRAVPGSSNKPRTSSLPKLDNPLVGMDP